MGQFSGGHRELVVNLARRTLGQRINTSIVPLNEGEKFKLDNVPEYRHPTWAVFAAIRPFIMGPSKVTLAKSLRLLAPLDSLGDISNWPLPWVLQTLLDEHLEGLDLLSLAAEAEDGRFGDASDWHRAEQRWMADGLGIGDFATWSNGRYLSSKVAVRGAPAVSFFGAIGGGIGNPQDLATLIEVTRAIATPSKQARLIEGISLITANTEHAGAVLSSFYELACEVAGRGSRSIRADIVGHLTSFHADCWGLGQFLNIADSAGRSDHVPSGLFFIDPGIPERCVQVFNSNIERRGLLPLIVGAMGYVEGYDLVEPAITKLHQSAAEPNPSDEPSVRASVALLRLVLDRWDEVDIPDIVEVLTSDTRYLARRFIATALSAKRTAMHPARNAILRALMDRVSVVAPRETLPFINLLTAGYESQLSPLTTAGECARLQLPSFPIAVGHMRTVTR
jgi:hypothetical protein